MLLGVPDQHCLDRGDKGEIPPFFDINDIPILVRQYSLIFFKQFC